MEKAGAQRLEAGAGFFGQFQPFAGAPEQHDAEQILERTDLLTDCGRRYRQLIRRAGER